MTYADALKEAFHEAVVNVALFKGETTVEMNKTKLRDALLFLKEKGFTTLMDLTAVDYIDPIKRTKVVYWLHNTENLERLRIIVYLNREEPLPTVTDIWAGANWYERELYDLFGVNVTGHPDLKRILMPDNWEGHPLLRDYALTEEPVQFKHGVKPKVPSEIITHVKTNIGNDTNVKIY